jgi:hypothetical protein
MYAPAAPQAPMLSSKGETNITAMYSVGGTGHSDDDKGYNEGYDLQGAYAVSDHVALTASFSHRSERDSYKAGTLYTNTPADVWYIRNATELGMGYFAPSGSRNKSFFDLYGGYGFGKFRLHESDQKTGGNVDLYHTTSIAKFYLQPGFHFNSDISQTAISFRFTAADYYHIMSDYTPLQEDSFHMATIRNTTFVFLEPSLALRMWAPNAAWLRFEVQVSTSIKLNNKAFYYRSSYLSLGLSFDLSKIGAHRGPTPKGEK